MKKKNKIAKMIFKLLLLSILVDGLNSVKLDVTAQESANALGNGIRFLFLMDPNPNKIKYVETDSDFQIALGGAGDNLVVIFFPENSLENSKAVLSWLNDRGSVNPNVVFVVVNPLNCKETASSYGIDVMPSFVLRKNQSKVARFDGDRTDTVLHLIRYYQSESLVKSAGSDEELNEMTNIKHNKLKIVYFFRESCNVSNLFLPVIDEMANRYKNVEFITVNVDECTEAAKKWEVSVPMYATQLRQKIIDRIPRLNPLEISDSIKVGIDTIENKVNKPGSTYYGLFDK